ncbi:Sec23/Sec24 trunk domain-containing protein [Gilbertella persicaria]|uniref:Sec23/Sec24 trunk domain-containing protein n=1 Tax=Gilbertella persicaria TaxID=101096 RepID=UPI00221FB9D7|nr:Sec23/Sec24 trunk domain-containing protein [Gilbertella persicaria]KAI8090117.1 Sec23/Sec24 trunk domain-containing protein [Gilbertella persicaria]
MMPLPQQGMARPPGMHPPMRPMTQAPMRPVMASPQARPVVSPQVRPSVVSPQPRPAIMPTQPHEPTYQHQPAVSPPQQQQQPQNLVGPMQHMHIHQQSKQSSKPKRVYINPDTTQPQPQVQPQGQPQVHPQMQPQPQAPWPNSLQQPYSTPSSIKSHHQSAGVGYTNAPYTHTGQQLPPELRPPSQPRPRIDPDQMPAPVQVREADADLFQDKFFGTLERDRVPFATTSFIGLDQGNCNPRFMRSTVDRVPSTKELTDKSKLPVGLIVQPLAKQRSDEVPIQVVQHGEEGPVRCSRCRAYVNPWCVFTHGGSRFECNICLHSNQVPDWYFANVDMSGRRVDVNERPELRYGSVEFEVTPDYFATDRLPVPLSYVFAIDVSIQSVQSGMLQAVCEGLKHALYDTEGNPKLDNRIGIMTFNKDVHFYNLAAELTSAQMLVVSDIHDMFLPLQAGFLAHLSESRHVILELLDHLPQMFKQTTRAESVYTSAVKGGLEALKSTGGQIFVFQTCLPNYGPDSLKPRDDKALDKEKSLLAPQSDTYRDLGKTCVKHGVCVHTWAFASQYMDAATVQTVSHLTGGDFRHYPNFSLAEKYSLYYQLDHDIHRETGFDGILRVRCSDGLQVMDHYGHCHMSVYTECDLAGVDQDKAMAVVLKHDGKLDENRGVSFQCALLYTNRQGQRRVRVHNLHLAATSQIADVFRYGDVDATISVLLRQAIFDMAHKNRKDIHTSMTDHCVDVLTAYRLNCAASTSPGQLILPEAFKLLPVYVHGAIRSKVLRGVGTDINIDVRVAAMSLFNTLSVEELVWTLYPRMYPLHELSLNENTANLKGEFRLPHMMRTSYERLEAHGCYLVDTGSDLYLWLGKSLPSAFIQDLFGVKTLDQVDPHMVHLPVQPTVLSTEVHGIMRQLQASRTRHLALRVVRQEKDAIEFLFSTWMSEDRNAEIQTYVDYMCVLHRKIQEEMKKHSG